MMLRSLVNQISRWVTPAFTACLAIPSLSAQGPTERMLRPPNSTLAEDFSRIVGIRELRDGRILVADAGDRRVVVADFVTRALTMISRQGRGPGEYTSVSPLYQLAGDSTLMPDPANGRWLVFNADHVVRTAPPDDPAVVKSRGGFRGADARGHIMITTAPDVRGGTQLFGKGDSVGVLLIALASGSADTIARLQMAPLILQSQLDKSGRPTSLSVLNPPLSVGEEPWLFPDGWIAVARLGPYRVDWRMPNGRWIRGSALPFDEQPVDAREREAFLNRRAQFSGTRSALPPEDAWPKTVPPFLSRPLVPAPDGTVWILRTPTADRPGNRYDQVDRLGRLVAWLELPPAQRLASLGSKAAYVINTDDDGLQRLTRHPWP